MKALLFPGQGSQIVGMCSDFYRNFSEVKNIFLEADDILKIKLSKLILEGPEDELKLTENTQPAIMTASYSIFKVLRNEFNLDVKSFKYFAGHSLGEYSALVCAESLTFKDSLFLLRERGKAMQQAVPDGEGAMLAVLGCKIEEVSKYINDLKEESVCEIANDNAEGQIIVSGEIKKIKKKSILLPVSAPFHCSLMKNAEQIMKEKITSINFKNPLIEIISNVTAKPHDNEENIKKLLISQICSKVRWRESILFMSQNKINDFIEIGPGKILSGMLKRIVKNYNSTSINSIEDAKKL
jgi:[acyl-carrier-protein] S-malonyltransferase